MNLRPNPSTVYRDSCTPMPRHLLLGPGPVTGTLCLGVSGSQELASGSRTAKARFLSGFPFSKQIVT